MIALNRRALLGAGAAAASLAALPARAAAPMLGTLPPAWHRFRIGSFEATVVSDGALPLGPPAANFTGGRPGEAEALLRSNFLPTENAVLEQNALVVNTGRHLVLFDTGMGDSMGAASRMFGPTTGRLLANLRAAGIEPAQIDIVAVTHAHVDHCWALVDAAGNRNFPNAQVAIAEADLRFWTDEANARGNDAMRPFFQGAAKNLNAYRDRMIMLRDGAEVVPGITAAAALGHTVGHHVFFVASGNQTVCNTGDLCHHQVLLLRRPNWEFAYDTDAKQAAATRVRMLDRLATDRTPILSYHFPWPGLGHVAREGEGFGWYPSAMNVTSLG